MPHLFSTMAASIKLSNFCFSQVKQLNTVSKSLNALNLSYFCKNKCYYFLNRPSISCSYHRRQFSTVNEAPADRIKSQFGFEKVNEDEKQEKVNRVFEDVAAKYDLMNDVMSMGIHRFWKDEFMHILNPTTDTKLLDVAGGTGDIAFRFIQHITTAAKNTKAEAITGGVTVCDINPSMLAVGRNRAEAISGADGLMKWVEGNAEKLPLESNQYSAYTIAFGIRNVTHMDKVLAEAYRVLQPGGRFLCLEFSFVNNSILRPVYDKYSLEVIPVLGYLFAGQWKAYQYLVESIRNFPDQETFKKMIQDAGFKCVTYTNFSCGIVAVHSGYKL